MVHSSDVRSAGRIRRCATSHDKGTTHPRATATLGPSTAFPSRLVPRVTLRHIQRSAIVSRHGGISWLGSLRRTFCAGVGCVLQPVDASNARSGRGRRCGLDGKRSGWRRRGRGRWRGRRKHRRHGRGRRRRGCYGFDAGIATAPKPPLAGLVDMQDISWHDTAGGEPSFTMANVDQFPGVFGGIVINATWDSIEPTQGGGLDFSTINAALAQVGAYDAANSGAHLGTKLRNLWRRERARVGQGHRGRSRHSPAQPPGVCERQLSAHHRSTVDDRLRQRMAHVPHEGRRAL